MGVPNGWETRAATQPWNGEPLGYDSPAADVLFDPATADGPYVIVASQSFSGMSGDEWSRSVRDWTCPEGTHEFWGWHIDGSYSGQFGPCNSGSLVETATRGYLIRLVASRAETPVVSDTWDTLKAMLETVDLRPDDAIDPAGTGKALPPCSDIAAGTRYTNRFGTPKLSATVPAGTDGYWQGYRDAFQMGDVCRSGGGIRITAAAVETVPTDPCDPTAGVGGNVSTPAEAAAAIADHIGHRTSEPTTVTIDGNVALRLEVSRSGSCPDWIGMWSTNELAPGQDAIIYLVDIGKDHPLGIGVWYDRGTTPARIAEAEAIVRSIRIRS